jgi:hypothetical protein
MVWPVATRASRTHRVGSRRRPAEAWLLTFKQVAPEAVNRFALPKQPS